MGMNRNETLTSESNGLNVLEGMGVSAMDTLLLSNPASNEFEEAEKSKENIQSAADTLLGATPEFEPLSMVDTPNYVEAPSDVDYERGIVDGIEYSMETDGQPLSDFERAMARKDINSKFFNVSISALDSFNSIIRNVSKLLPEEYQVKKDWTQLQLKAIDAGMNKLGNLSGIEGDNSFLEDEYLQKKEGINLAGDIGGIMMVGNAGFNMAASSRFVNLNKAKEGVEKAREAMIVLAKTGKFANKTGVNPFYTGMAEMGKATIAGEALATTAYWNNDIFKPSERNWKADLGIIAGGTALAAAIPGYHAFKAGRAAISEANEIANGVRIAEGVGYVPMELFSKNKIMNSANTTVLGNNIKWLEEKSKVDSSGFYDELVRTRGAARLSVGGLVKGGKPSAERVLSNYGNHIDGLISKDPNSFYGVENISELTGEYNSAKAVKRGSEQSREVNLRVKALQASAKGQVNKAEKLTEKAETISNKASMIMRQDGEIIPAHQYWLPERLASGSKIVISNPKGEGLKAPIVMANGRNGNRVSIDIGTGVTNGMKVDKEAEKIGDISYAAFNEMEAKIGIDKLGNYGYRKAEDVDNWFEADWIARRFDGRTDMAEHSQKLKNEYLEKNLEAFNLPNELFEQTFGINKKGELVNRFNVDSKLPINLEYNYNKFDRIGENEALAQSLKMVEDANAKRLADLKVVGEENEIVKASSLFVESPAYSQFRQNIDTLSYTEYSTADMFSQRQFLFKDKALKPLFQGLNKLKTEVSSKINKRLTPLKENLSVLLKTKEDTKAFSEFAHMSRMGFVIEEIGNGQAIIDIPKSERAFRRLEKLTGKEVPRTDYLPGMNGQPLTFSKATEDSLNLWNDANAYSAKGLYGIRGWDGSKVKNYHFPPKKLNKENLAFLYEDLGNGNTGELVAVVASDYKANFRSLVEKEKGLYGKPLIEVGKDTKGFQDITALDEAKWVDMDDYSKTIGQTVNRDESTAYRTSVANIVNDGAEFVNEAFDGLQRQYFALSNTALIKGAAPELKYLNSLADKNNFNMSGVGAAIEMITGKPTVGKSEGFIKFLDAVSEGIVSAGEVVSNTVNNLRKFNQKAFTNQMNRYIPSEIARFSTQGVIGGAAKWANKAYLMHGNIAYALTNFLSLPTSLTLWKNTLKRLPNETTGMWQNRIGVFGKVVDDSRGGLQPFVLPDVGATISETFKKMVSKPKEMREWLDWAKKNSVVDEAVAEFFSNSYGIKEKSTFGTMISALDNGLSKIASASDQASKIIAAKIGYDIGKAGGLIDESLVLFSRQVSDLIAGNYTLLNKPSVARNEFGALNYTFMTYAQGLTERMLESVGNKQHRAFLSAMSVNAMMFGTDSIAGMDSIKQLSGYKNEGESLYSDISREYGDSVARLFTYGGWGAVTGTDLSKKGSIADSRLPFIRNPAELVGVQLMGDTLKGLVDITKEVSKATDDGISTERLMNILSKSGFPALVTNGSRAAQGYTTDTKGAIVEEYNTGIERILTAGGFKMIVNAEMNKTRGQAFEANKLRSERMNALSVRTRAKAREQGFVGIEDMVGLAKEFQKAGGSLPEFSRWYQSELREGLQGFIERGLARKPSSVGQIKQFQNLMSISSEGMEMNEEE